MSNKICPWCYQLIDEPVKNTRERIEMAASMETGKRIYYAIRDAKLFRSIDLCNLDYTLLMIYRKENPLVRCHGDLELAYGKMILEDKYKNM